ncbi:MAG: pyruvate dehydrogenase complex dihydrolipoamide acetyltransferase [Opitutaceae bacterium]
MAQIIDMPKLSDTMTVGTLVKWLKKEGDAVKSGDMLAEVETDKATMELESFFDGTLIKQFVAAGAQVEIGGPLAAIGKPGEKVEAPVSPKASQGAAPPEASKSAPAAAPATPSATSAKESAPKAEAPAKASAPAAAPASAPLASNPSPSTPPATGRLRISPLARKLAEEKGLDFSRVTGSGPHGRIVRADILAAAKNPPAPAAKAAGPKADTWPWRSVMDKTPVQADSVAPLSNMRTVIARRLVESKTTIPHFYLEIEVDVAALTALRNNLNAGLAKDGVRLSVNDFILKASAAALRAVPSVNSSWDNTGIKYHSAAHVSFAVAIDDGLITPVIKDTDKKTVFQISTEAKDMGKRAKEKKLAPAEFTGGTFCVSNLGMMGITRFSAIINPPNSAILAVGATQQVPVVKNGQIVIGERLALTLSCDHRVVDGALGAKFLNAIRDHLEYPALLLL